MKLIKLSDLLKAIPDFDLPTDTIDACSLRIILSQLPTVGIVQCKDCKHWLKEKEVCKRYLCREESDDFCSHGKTK